MEKQPHAATWADGAIAQGYGSKRGSIPEGRREAASLIVLLLRRHYGSELGDGGHPALVLGLRRWPCRQCTSSSSPIDGIRPDLWPLVRREREWPPPSFLDLERVIV